MRSDTWIENEEGGRRGPYRRWRLNEKRNIVEQCLKPGASVAGIALAHGANANLVRKWIDKYRAGEYGEAGTKLLPVALPAAKEARPATGEPATKGVIEIELPAARVRVHGRVDTEVLRTVLGCLCR